MSNGKMSTRTRHTVEANKKKKSKWITRDRGKQRDEKKRDEWVTHYTRQEQRVDPQHQSMSEWVDVNNTIKWKMITRKMVLVRTSRSEKSKYCTCTCTYMCSQPKRSVSEWMGSAGCHNYHRRVSLRHYSCSCSSLQLPAVGLSSQQLQSWGQMLQLLTRQWVTGQDGTLNTTGDSVCSHRLVA